MTAVDQVTFRLERFGWSTRDRLELMGRWSGVDLKDPVTPVIVARAADGEHRLDALPDLRGRLRVDEALKEVTTEQAKNVPAHQRLSDSLIVGPTKTHATRTLPLPASVAADLRAHLATPLPGGQDPRSFIFTTPGGAPVRHNLFYKRVFSPLAPGTRFHDLRHTCASWLIAANAHPLAVKNYLGHEDIRTTMNVYGHLFPTGLDALAAGLDAARSAAKPAGAGNVVVLG